MATALHGEEENWLPRAPGPQGLSASFGHDMAAMAPQGQAAWTNGGLMLHEQYGTLGS